ncbi:MAG: hypothetical protein MJ053_07090 [Elusimicrobiaceae bacterium]|nr:hypothetical protein [Elusimicrobiaceae bacterium]
MKKLTLCLFLLLGVCSTAFTRPAARLERRVQERVEQQQSVLYTTVEQALKHYYGKDYAPDPQRTTGWYRVDDFLTWVKTHPQELEDMIRQGHLTQESGLGQSFWLQLGVRYIASVYGIKADFSKLPITYNVGDGDGRASSGKDRLKVFAGPSQLVPMLINDGIHEGTHILPILSSEKVSAHHLDELAAFYSQYNFGLPVKVSDVQNFGHGIRDVRRTYTLKGDFDLSREYNYFIAGIILNPLLTKQEMLEREDMWARAYTNMAIWTTVANLIAVRDGHYWELNTLDSDMEGLEDVHLSHKGFEGIYDYPGVPFYVGEYQLGSGTKIAIFVRFDENLQEVFFEYGTLPTSEEDYLDKLFGDRAPALYAFYDALINNLPQEVVQEVRTLWPVQQNGMFMITQDSYFAGWEKFGKPYSAPITQAVIRALEQVNAPSVPPLPKGYL